MRQLWKHQRESADRAELRDDFALLHEVGVGKTITAIEILRRWYKKAGGLVPTLVLVPPIVIENWRREVLENSSLGPDRILCLTGTGKQRLEKLKAIPDRGRIIVTNYETLLMEPVFELLRQFVAGGILIADEVHRCKDIRSKRTKRAVTLADVSAKRLVLTGTPVLNSPADLFSEYRICDKGRTFGTNFFVFRAGYFIDKNAGMPKSKYFPNWKLRPGALDEISQKIAPSSASVRKQDCLDLPAMVRKSIYVEMSPSQRKIYEDMRDDYLAYIDGKASVATLAITKALRMQQIVSGHVTVVGDGDGGAGEIKRIKDNPRAEALSQLLDNLARDHKTIVWAVFRENYNTIKAVCDQLDLPYLEIHGDISPAQKVQNMDLFNTNPAYRVLISHPGSGGVGVNFCSSNVSIWYSRSFSLEQDIQAEARNYRAGSEIHEKITRYDLVTLGTIDEVVLKALSEKQAVSTKVLQAARAMI